MITNTKFRAHKIGVAGATKDNERLKRHAKQGWTLYKIKEFKNIVLVVGSEGEGIRQLVKKNCDFLLKVETNSEVESLNVSVATAIALYEINRR